MDGVLFEFPKGWELLKKIPSVGEVWMFYGTTHCKAIVIVLQLLQYVCNSQNDFSSHFYEQVTHMICPIAMAFPADS